MPVCGRCWTVKRSHLTKPNVTMCKCLQIGYYSKNVGYKSLTKFSSLSKNELFNMKNLLLMIALCLSFTFDSFAENAITITYGSDYKPFAWDEEDVPYGVQKDFVEEILGNRLGIKVIHETCP